MVTANRWTIMARAGQVHFAPLSPQCEGQSVILTQGPRDLGFWRIIYPRLGSVCCGLLRRRPKKDWLLIPGLLQNQIKWDSEIPRSERRRACYG
ncbi:hypothetical protein RRG08_036761 [Elysia crispata]|uniref:Uncharacterized protein n=1 Tax=Elysia crispata TaxID=231223 RepID=A0AAE1CVB4_9GAST|nr:hypothetical protein RRG08_036761 [Elysia crispata]